jgi:hypothetical protein
MICGKERNGPSTGSDESVSLTTLLQAPGRSKAGTKTKVCAKVSMDLRPSPDKGTICSRRMQRAAPLKVLNSPKHKEA